MKTRDATFPRVKNWGLRRAFLLALPMLLAGAAWEMRHLQQLRQPISIRLPAREYMRRADGNLMRNEYENPTYKPQKTPTFQQLITRLIVENQEHPLASSISVFQTTPWPKESGMNLNDSQSLIYNRKAQTLGYVESGGVGGYGWTYSHVENSGMKVLAKVNLKDSLISLPLEIDAQLRSRGWTLTEHYLP